LDSQRKQRGGRAGYLELVRDNTNFRMLWFGQIISLLGDWFNLIASASLIGALTESGLAVSGLFVVRALAPFLVSPFAGVAADRYSRKWILILADIGRAITVMGFLLVRNAQDVWLLFVLTSIQLAISGFFFPARTAILPDIVAPEGLGAANALSSATWSVMLALGAALGGIVAGGWGIYPAFVIDALTFLVSAALIGRVTYTAAPAVIASGSVLIAALRQYVDGLRYLIDHKDILIISLHKAAFSLVAGGPLQVLQVVLAEQVFVIGEGGGTSLGLMYAVAGVGTGLGPIVARRFTEDRDRPLRVALALSYAIGALGLALMAPLRGFGLVLFGTLLRAVGGGIGWVFATQLLLQLVPNRVRGRVFSTEFALFTLMNAVGTAAGGWALDSSKVGLSGMLWAMAALILVPGALWTLWITIGRRRNLPAPEV
jgi:MFS family permease